MAVRASAGTAAAQLAAFALELDYETIPADVVSAAKEHLLDALGCGLAAHALGEGAAARTVALAMGGVEEASVIGASGRYPAPSAALANGMLMHALDFDDTHADSVAHISVVVAPAAMAEAECHGHGGRSLIAALVAGNEIVARVGMAASGEFHARGFHPTAIAGVFGATAAAAKLSGLGPLDAASAFGIAGSQASGLFAYLDAGTQTKPIHAGWAAHAGVLAARLAAAGGEGPASVLEGRFGLYDAFLGHVPDLNEQLADLGSRWETPRIAYKPYPACHYMHGAVGAAATLGALDAGEIEDILVTVPPGSAVDLVLEPEAAKFAPRTPYEAKFSLQYSLAALLVHGQLDLGSYLPDAIGEAAVLEVARRIRYQTREFASFPAAFPGGVAITLRDGRVLSAELPYQAGAPENPLAGSAISAKFRQNAGLALEPDRVEELEQAILALEDADDVGAVFGLLA
jgi:2-methylcitrate dehydratase PrpD